MARVLRWGRSAYETPDDMERERAAAVALGYDWSSVEDRGAPPAGIDDAEVLVVTSKVRVNEPVLSRFSGGLVLTTTSGTDHIDVVAAHARGLTVGRCPLARRDAVVEHTVGGLIHMLRRNPDLHAATQAGRWARAELPSLAPVGLAGLAVVVVGYGVIGRRAAEVLDALGADVRVVDPFVSVAPRCAWTLHEALRGAGAVTLHCALTSSSRGLIGARELHLLAPDAVVVSTARGESLDVAEAARRVHRGQLGGLVVDVFPAEPWEDAAPLQHPRILATPHAAGFTRDLGRKVSDEVAATLARWREGGSVPHPVLPAP